MMGAIARAFQVTQTIESQTAAAFAAGMDLGCQSLRDIEAASIDRGTVDHSLVRANAVKQPSCVPFAA